MLGIKAGHTISFIMNEKINNILICLPLFTEMILDFLHFFVFSFLQQIYPITRVQKDHTRCRNVDKIEL